MSAAAPRWKRAALWASVLLLAAALCWDLSRRLWPVSRPAIYEGRTDAWSGPPLAFRLREASGDSGIHHRHRKFAAHPSLANIEPWIVAYEGGVAVTDFDRDGWQDIYLTSGGQGSPNSMFRNRGDGRFEEVGARLGLADLNVNTGSARPLFFDFDDDGYQDLLLTTYHCAKLLRNERGRRFRDVTKKSGLRHCGFAPASNALDFDGDGDLDLVIGNYFKEAADLAAPTDYEFMHHDYRRSTNGGKVFFYENKGNGRFVPVPGNLGIRDPVWNLSIGVYDFRGTGRPDLHFATDYSLDRLYFNEGGRRFIDASAELADTQSLSSMSSETAEPFNDGRPALFVSNIFSPRYVAEGNVLWRMGPDGRFRDEARPAGLWRCGWAWGPKFGDLDNDGRQDLVVVNGYISADKGKDYWDAMGAFIGEHAPMQDARSWPPMRDATMDGYQQSCVFMNTGKGFVNAAAGTGLKGDLSDGRGLALIDFRNDGSLSLVINNLGQDASFYSNTQANGNHWLGFSLEGRRSCRDAFGTRVEIRLEDGTRLTRQLQPANGFASQSDGRLHFGLGKDPKIAEIVVRWPAGGVQRLDGLALDKYHHLVEPR